MERQLHVLVIANLAVLGLVFFVAFMWLCFMIEKRFPTGVPSHVIERRKRIAEACRVSQEPTEPFPDREHDGDD